MEEAETHLKEVRNEISDLLHSWLEKEMIQRFQHIDQKLEILMARNGAAPKTSLRKTLVNRRLSPSSKSQGECMKSSPVARGEKRSVEETLVHTTSYLSVADSTFRGPSGGSRMGSARLELDGIDQPPSPSLIESSRSNARYQTGHTSDSLAPHKGPTKSRILPTLALPDIHILPTKRRLASTRYIEEVQTFIATQTRGKNATAIWRFLENPYSSLLAWLYSVFIPIFVLTSVLISFLHTVKDSPLKGGLGMWLQAGFETVYAAELTVRFVVCPSRIAFFFSWFNWIDAVSAMPIVLRIFADRDVLENDDHASTHWAKSIVVAVPFLRMLKIIRRFEKFHLLVSAFSMAFEALPVLLYNLMLIALLFSVFIYFLEPEENIGSLPTALWFVFVTMTTVGYGDFVPISIPGNVVTVALMIVSFLYMAIPIGIVGNAFSQVWSNRDRLLLMHRIRESFLQEGFTAESMKKIVSFFDEDGDGELDLYEFKVMLETINVNISEERVILLFDGIDRDGGGTVNVEELINSLFPKGYLEAWRDSVELAKQYHHLEILTSPQDHFSHRIQDTGSPPSPLVFVQDPDGSSHDRVSPERDAGSKESTEVTTNQAASAAPKVTVAWVA